MTALTPAERAVFAAADQMLGSDITAVAESVARRVEYEVQSGIADALAAKAKDSSSPSVWLDAAITARMWTADRASTLADECERAAVRSS